MTEPLYISRVRVETAGPMHRRAVLPTGTTVDMGVVEIAWTADVHHEPA